MCISPSGVTSLRSDHAPLSVKTSRAKSSVHFARKVNTRSGEMGGAGVEEMTMAEAFYAPFNGRVVPPGSQHRRTLGPDKSALRTAGHVVGTGVGKSR